MRKHTTLYLYELAWILPSVALPVGMLAALAVTAFGAHIGLPGEVGRVDPATVMQTAPFNQPGVVEVAPGRYEARLVAGIWFFTPPEIRVPEGSEVTFVATSKDVIEILRETPSFRAGRKGGGPTGATAEPSGGVEAPSFRPGRTSTAMTRALIVVVLCIIGAIDMRPVDAQEHRPHAAGMA